MLFSRTPRHHPLVAALRQLRDDFAAVSRDVQHLLRDVHNLREQLMTATDDLNARIDALTTAVDQAKARIAEDFEALRDQLANGVSGPELDAAVARLDASIASLNAVDPDPTNPEPEPQPEPEV